MEPDESVVSSGVDRCSQHVDANLPIFFSVTPTSLTVIASCSDNGNTYPVGPTNAAGEVENVIPGSATEIVWSPYDYEQNKQNTPLAAATYRLQIFDERGTAAAQAGGRFSPYSGMQFALYFPQTYVPLSRESIQYRERDGGGFTDISRIVDLEWHCANCSSGTKLVTNPLFLMLFTSLVMLISGWGLIGGRRGRA
jgi:hypothetical protein